MMMISKLVSATQPLSQASNHYIHLPIQDLSIWTSHRPLNFNLSYMSEIKQILLSLPNKHIIDIAII